MGSEMCIRDSQRPALSDRRAHHPPPRTSNKPTDPATHRGTLRLDQDHRRRSQAPLPGPATQPGLVPHHDRHLQPPAHHRPQRQHHLARRTTPTPAGSHSEHQPRAPQAAYPSTALLPHPARRSSGAGKPAPACGRAPQAPVLGQTARFVCQVGSYGDSQRIDSYVPCCAAWRSPSVAHSASVERDTATTSRASKRGSVLRGGT